MSFYVNCANCGQQVLINGPEDECYWCGEKGSKEHWPESVEEIEAKEGHYKVWWN